MLRQRAARPPHCREPASVWRPLLDLGHVAFTPAVQKPTHRSQSPSLQNLLSSVAERIQELSKFTSTFDLHHFLGSSELLKLLPRGGSVHALEQSTSPPGMEACVPPGL